MAPRLSTSLLSSTSSLTLSARAFSTSTPCLAKSSAKKLAELHANIPPYPHGASTFYKQSNFGLYGHSKIRFGNMVSHKNEIKTRRHWRPNVHQKRLWSPALGKFLRLRVTTRVLRTIDKCGGLDEYLLGETKGRIKELGMGGWKLRWRLLQTEKVKERFRQQRIALGLPADGETYTSSEGLPSTKQQVEDEVAKYDEELAREEEIDIGEPESQQEQFMKEEAPKEVKA
jgi:large subunit ribosomal protein L28